MQRSLEHDYFDPLVWNERNGFLVSGHLRLKVLVGMGFTHVDVSVVDYPEPVHCARMIAANRPLGEFEEALLTELAGVIELAGLDAALAGYDTKSLMALLEPPAVEDDTASAEELVSKAEVLQEKWQVQTGDVYQIGNHRLMCGDCSSLDNWSELLEGRQADMVWIDPPYNVSYAQLQEHRNEMKREKGEVVNTKPEALMNDSMNSAKYVLMMKGWFTAAFVMTKPGGSIYIAHAECYGYETRAAALQVGFKISQCLIWVKNSFTLGRQDYQWQHEPVLYGWKPGDGHYWQGGYKQKTVLDEEADLSKKTKPELIHMINEMRNGRDTTIVREPKRTGGDEHPTVKPLGLVARQIWNSSQRGDTVLELFGGSGTTLAAAEQTGRRCVATELDPKFCAVILERLTAMGLSAVKISKT